MIDALPLNWSDAT